MFLRTLVIEWLTKRDGKNRISKLDTEFSGGRTYMFNGNRIVNPRTVGTYTMFDFYDNPGSRKESPSIVTVTASKVQVLAAMNGDFSTSFITFPFFKDNNHNKPTTNIVVPTKSIAYIDTYNGDPAYSWVIYYLNDFKRVESLCDYSMDEIFALGGGTLPPTSVTWDSILVRFDDSTVTFDAA